MEFRFGSHDTGGARLRFAEAGDAANPLLLCLHGFPEFWIAWRPVMERLADRFHVVAPDQRGYGGSTAPADVDAYRARNLVADIDSLADRLSPGKPFVLAGHDWGASVAYAFAIARPERLTHLIVANGVHPACFQRAIFEDAEQRRASQYINTLRLPDIETRLAEDGYRRLLRMMTEFSEADWMTPQLAAQYRAAWSGPGVLSGMLNWYRASPIEVPEAGRAGAGLFTDPRHAGESALAVRVPHLVCGERPTRRLRPSCLADLADFVPDLTVQRFAGRGHWILHENPDGVAAAIRDFAAA